MEYLFSSLYSDHNLEIVMLALLRTNVSSPLRPPIPPLGADANPDKAKKSSHVAYTSKRHSRPVFLPAIFSRRLKQAPSNGNGRQAADGNDCVTASIVASVVFGLAQLPEADMSLVSFFPM